MKKILQIIGKNIIAFTVSFILLMVAIGISPDHTGYFLIAWILLLIGFFAYSIKSTYEKGNIKEEKPSLIQKEYPSPVQNEYDVWELLKVETFEINGQKHEAPGDSLKPMPMFTESLKTSTDYSGNISKEVYANIKQQLFNRDEKYFIEKDKYPEMKWHQLMTIDHIFRFSEIESSKDGYMVYIYSIKENKDTFVFFRDRDVKIKSNQLKITLRDETKVGSITIQYDYDNVYKNIYVVKFKGWGMDICKRGVILTDPIEY